MGVMGWALMGFLVVLGGESTVRPCLQTTTVCACTAEETETPPLPPSQAPRFSSQRSMAYRFFRLSGMWSTPPFHFSTREGRGLRTFLRGVLLRLRTF